VPAAMMASGEQRTGFWSLVKLAAPIAVSQAGYAMMGLVDTAVVGRAGAVPLAAVGLANAVFIAFTIFGMGVLIGLDGLISQSLGAGQPTRGRELFWTGIWMSGGLALALTPPMVASTFFLEQAGIEPAVASDTRIYLLIRALSVFPVYIFFVQRAYLQALKRTRDLVVAAVAANVVNLFADILLVFGGGNLPEWTGPLRLVPPMGAAGAAIATVVCSYVQVAIAWRGVGAVPAPGRPRRSWSSEDARAVARLGVPVGLHYLAEVGVFALAGFLAGRMGALNMGAHQVAITIASLTFCLALGIGNAGSVMVGWAVGARDTQEARRAGMRAFGAAALFMGMNAILLSVFSRGIASLITDQQDVLDIAAPLLVVAGAFQLSDGIQGVGAGVLRGAGDSRFTFVANVVGHYVIGLPIAMLLGPLGSGGVRGIWWGLSVGLTAVAVALFARFWRLSSREIVPVDTRREDDRKAQGTQALDGLGPALREETAGSP